MAAAPRLEIAAQGAKNPKTLEFLKSSPKQLLIDGKWVAAKSGKTFESINPANEEVLAEVAEAGPEDIDAAVKASRVEKKSVARKKSSRLIDRQGRLCHFVRR
jgi:hypothetical protein